MNKFKVGDVVVWKKTDSSFNAKKGDSAVVVKAYATDIKVRWLINNGQMNGLYSAERFELYKPSFNPLKDPWYILTPTKEAFDDAVAWAKSVGVHVLVRLPKQEEKVHYVRSNHGVLNWDEERLFNEYCEGYKQITLTKSISYEYNIVEEETEEQKAAKKKAEVIFQDGINAVRIEMEALAKRLKDLEG